MHQALKHWGLPHGLPPDAGTLARLHGLWLDHVAFENVTKLLAVSSRASSEWRRGPDRFWSDHVEQGTGGTCFAATIACADLLRNIGFEPRIVFCAVPGRTRRSHAALVVPATDDVPGGNAASHYLVDVGYPMPEPIPLPHGPSAVRRRTVFYDVILKRGEGGEFLVLTEDSRGIQFRYSFRPSPVSQSSLAAAWQRTFRSDAPYMSRLALGRFRGDTRFIYKGPNSLFVLSREYQEIRVVPASETGTLSEIFGIEGELLNAANTVLEKGFPRRAAATAWHDLSLRNSSRLRERRPGSSAVLGIPVEETT